MSRRTIAIIFMVGLLVGLSAIWIGWWATPLGVLVGLPGGILLAKWDSRDEQRREAELLRRREARWDQ